MKTGLERDSLVCGQGVNCSCMSWPNGKQDEEVGNSLQPYVYQPFQELVNVWRVLRARAKRERDKLFLESGV